MISDAAVSLLSNLRYEPAARRTSCAIPFAGVYWEDELPDIRELVTLSEAERIDVFRVLAVRVKIWNDEPLTDDEQQLWSQSRSRIPAWPLFRRLNPSQEDRQAQADTENEVAEGLAQVLGDADEVVLDKDENGIERWSATFDLTKNTVRQQSWWRVAHPSPSGEGALRHCTFRYRPRSNSFRLSRAARRWLAERF